MSMYIKGMGNISPQQTWGDKALLSLAAEYHTARLSCIEPDYAAWIDPKYLRRMSRIIKMGVTSAIMALQEAEVKVPDGIITGTGYGCLEDTGSFLSKMISNKEDALNPTPFIQSTHNTIGSQIALMLQCLGYNQTFTHNAFSFESVLLDAMLQLSDEPSRSLLVGGLEEITSESHAIQSRFGIFRKEITNSLDLFKKTGKGTLNGEGSAFFVLSGKPDEKDLACIEGVTTLYKPATGELEEAIERFLSRVALRVNDIDLLISGKSGDEETDKRLHFIEDIFFKNSSMAVFKHLSGEYPVATAFAVWLGTRILDDQHIPDIVLCRDMKRPLKNVLIHNQYFGTHHSIILLKQC